MLQKHMEMYVYIRNTDYVYVIYKQLLGFMLGEQGGINHHFQPPAAPLEIFQNISTPVNSEVFAISTGAGFLPSTVWYLYLNTILSSSMSTVDVKGLCF